MIRLTRRRVAESWEIRRGPGQTLPRKASPVKLDGEELPRIDAAGLVVPDEHRGMICTVIPSGPDRVNPMEHVVRLEQVDSRPIAVERLRASSHELAMVVPAACGRVWSVIQAQKIAGAGRHIALYLDDQINLEVGVELESPFVGHGDVVGSATPAGAVATSTHLGPYGGLHEAHRAIHAWCEDRGYELAGPSWEIYGHWEDAWVSDPAKIRTDIFYLLKPGDTKAD